MRGGTFRKRNIISGSKDNNLTLSEFCNIINMAKETSILYRLPHAYPMRPPIGQRHLLHDLKGPVCRAIVRQDNLQRLIGLGKRPFHCLTDIFLLIVGEQRKGHERALGRARGSRRHALRIIHPFILSPTAAISSSLPTASILADRRIKAQTPIPAARRTPRPAPRGSDQRPATSTTAAAAIRAAACARTAQVHWKPIRRPPNHQTSGKYAAYVAR